MFCEKCGAPNTDNAKFCGNCGNPMGPVAEATSFEPKAEVKAEPCVAGEQVFAAAQPKENKPMSLKTLIILIAVSAFITFCMVFCFMGKLATNPDKVVEKFMDALAKGKYEQMYDCFAIPEGQFTTKEMFVHVIEKELEDEEFEIEDYTITEIRSSNKLQKNPKTFFSIIL